MSSERKLDIHALLHAADRRDHNWFSRQPDDVRKEFAPIVAIRWAATVNDGDVAMYTLWLVNEQVNPHLFLLHKHPDLVYRLLAGCGLGQPLHHHYLPMTGKRKSDKVFDLFAQHYPDANDREIELLISLHSKESFAAFLDECGLQKDDAKAMLKNYEQR